MGLPGGAGYSRKEREPTQRWQKWLSGQRIKVRGAAGLAATSGIQGAQEAAARPPGAARGVGGEG